MGYLCSNQSVNQIRNEKPLLNSVRHFSVQISTLDLPALSPTMTHGTIASWTMKPGDAFGAGDVICEIETDKASMGFEMQDEGVLAKILVDEKGPEVACGAPIALVVEDVDAYTAFLALDAKDQVAPSSSSSSPAPTDVPASSTEPAAAVASTPVAFAATGPQRLSPAANHMANSKNLDTTSLVGTSKHGIISLADIILALQAGALPTKSIALAPVSGPVPTATATTTAIAPTTTAAATVASSVVPATAVAPVVLALDEPVNDKYTDIPNTGMRKVIAKRLTESKAHVPHYYSSIECEIDELLKLRKTLKRDFDINVSVNDLVIKAAALALRDVPQANAKWNTKTQSIDSGEGVVDISVAVATPSGLITPIITKADKRGLVDINTSVKDLATRARLGKLLPEEYQGGSFSISNLGMFGINSFSAVINPPQACILAVGAGIAKVVPPRDGRTKPLVVTKVTVQLSSDRRVVNEATAGLFLQTFRSYFSSPKQTLM